MGRTACTEPQCLYKGALYFFYVHSALEIRQSALEIVHDLHNKYEKHTQNVDHKTSGEEIA